MIKVRQTWFQRHHWYFKGFLVLLTGTFALTGKPGFIALFIVISFWMTYVALQFLHGKYWTWSRRRRYARLSYDQREDAQRRIINQFEYLFAQTFAWYALPDMTRAQLATYKQQSKNRDALSSIVMLYEQWRSELLGVPLRSLPDIRRYWMEHDLK